MKYYLMSLNFETDEGQYVEGGGTVNMMNIDIDTRIFHTIPFIDVHTYYTERGFSDFLKSGGSLNASSKVQKLFFEHGFQGVQFIPLLVNNDGSHKGYSFMHNIAVYDLLDPVASEADLFYESTQHFTFVVDLFLDENKFGAANILHDIFMCSNYSGEFICNENIKQVLETENVTGIEFNPVEFSS